jgi:hypothetical protein
VVSSFVLEGVVIVIWAEEVDDFIFLVKDPAEMIEAGPENVVLFDRIKSIQQDWAVANNELYFAAAEQSIFPVHLAGEEIDLIHALDRSVDIRPFTGQLVDYFAVAAQFLAMHKEFVGQNAFACAGSTEELYTSHEWPPFLLLLHLSGRQSNPSYNLAKESLMFEPLLPLVNAELCYSLQKEVDNVPDKKYVAQQMRALKKNNPVIALWIKEFSKTSKDRLSTMICALMVYRMLESQLECDVMADLL